MFNDRKTAAVICAGGTGKRMGAGRPKQFIEMEDGTSILRKSVDAFRGEIEGGRFDLIVVTCPSGYEDETDELANSGCSEEERAEIVTGGKERQDSVRNALEYLSYEGYGGDDIVLIHDGARPYVTKEIIKGVVDATIEHRAAIAAVPVKDTIRDIEHGTLERSRLYSVQTPQGFCVSVIHEAVEKACADGFYGTDDGGLVERLGVIPVIAEGSYSNIKITTPEDL